MAENNPSRTHQTSNILGALSLLIQDRVEAAWQSELDISPMAAAALNQIENYPGTSIEEVAGRIGLSHSATVRLSDKLAERELVAKDRARRDARQQSLHLTREGKRMTQSLHTARNQVIDNLLTRLDPAAVETLHTLIGAMLGRAVTTQQEGDIVCRVCDDRRCNERICPIQVG